MDRWAGQLEAGGQLSGADAGQRGGLLGIGGLPGGEALVPGGTGGSAALGHGGAGALDDGLVEGEGLLRQAEELLHGVDLVLADGGAVDALGALLGGQRPADDGVELDDGGPVGDPLGRLDGVVEGLDVLLVALAAVGPVDLGGVPAVGGVAGQHVLVEGDRGIALDGDAVRVVDDDEVAELLGAGQRGGLGLHPLLHAAVAGDDVDEVVEDRLAGSGVRVVQAVLVAGGHGHADGHRDTGAQRAGGALDVLRVAVLRVARGQGVRLAQPLQVVEFEAETVDVDLRVLEHRGVTCGQHEAVAPDPLVVPRIGVHDLLVEQVGDGGQ